MPVVWSGDRQHIRNHIQSTIGMLPFHDGCEQGAALGNDRIVEIELGVMQKLASLGPTLSEPEISARLGLKHK